MPTSLKHLADIVFGVYEKPGGDGDVVYLQVKHFQDGELRQQNMDSFLDESKVGSQHLLRDGDVLFAGKGFRNFAWCFRATSLKAIASSAFFVIRSKSSSIHPEYLAAYLNLPFSQEYFQKLGAGVTIPSIRKGELAEFGIPLPSMEIQHKIADIARLHREDMALSQQIIHQKERLYHTAVQQLVQL